ncbi:universal stress protein [Fluviicola sp.]|uniref:universal stress protein n=1 Tax=Fluviicola sp. TaxID=1917219 RepID=UPI003D2B16B4
MKTLAKEPEATAPFKKMLIPVDFSEISNNALEYAIQLAKKTNSALHLLHAYDLQVFMYDPTQVSPAEYDREKEILHELEKLKKAILLKNPGLTVVHHATLGVPVDEINAYSKKERIDLIVIGTQGAGYIQERILGSTTSLLIRSAKTPVIVIDKEVKFKNPKQIVLAADFQKTDHKKVLEPLKDLAKLYNSHICVLNVYPHVQLLPSLEEIPEGFRLDYYLKGIEHTFFSLESNQIVQSINQFITDHDIDMVAMIARKHSFFSRLFREPLTTKMSFHSRVPLLVLHD